MKFYREIVSYGEIFPPSNIVKMSFINILNIDDKVKTNIGLIKKVKFDRLFKFEIPTMWWANNPLHMVLRINAFGFYVHE